MSGTSNRSSHFLQFINLFVIKIQEKNPRFWYFYFFTLISTITMCVLYSSSELFTHLLNQFSYLSYVLRTHKRKGKNYQDAFVCHYSFRNWYSNPVWLNNNKMNGNIEWSRYIQRWKKRIGNFFLRISIELNYAKGVEIFFLLGFTTLVVFFFLWMNSIRNSSGFSLGNLSYTYNFIFKKLLDKEES